MELRNDALMELPADLSSLAVEGNDFTDGIPDWSPAEAQRRRDFLLVDPTSASLRLCVANIWTQVTGATRGRPGAAWGTKQDSQGTRLRDVALNR